MHLIVLLKSASKSDKNLVSCNHFYSVGKRCYFLLIVYLVSVYDVTVTVLLMYVKASL